MSGLACRTGFIIQRMNRQKICKLFSGKGLTWLLLLLVLLLNFGIRWRLRDLPLERDEGEYAYAGQLILQGIPPYELAWNMKFPGVYFAYAGLMAIYGQSPIGIHCGLILVSSLSLVLIFLIGRELMDAAGGLLAAAFFFALLCALPFTYGLAAHTTHFVVLFVSLGVYALLKMEKSKPSIWASVAGLSFGSAILMKQHAVIFAAAAGAALLWRARSRKLFAFRGAAIFLFATAFPLLLVCFGLAWAGVWDRFRFLDHPVRPRVCLVPFPSAPRRASLRQDSIPFWTTVCGFGGSVWLASLAGFSPRSRTARRRFWRRLAPDRTGRNHPGILFSRPLLFDGHARTRAAERGVAARARRPNPERRAHGPVLRMVAVCLFLVGRWRLVPEKCRRLV